MIFVNDSCDLLLVLEHKDLSIAVISSEKNCKLPLIAHSGHSAQSICPLCAGSGFFFSCNFMSATIHIQYSFFNYDIY